ncbi:MAG: putative ABC transport system permease protein [Limisphaerales bacterium]|jgi:putative ABC transport system permease protein
MKRLLLNSSIAFQAMLGNKLRSALTALGIIFGVASVIAMLAVGKGTQVEVLQQFELIGAKNIVVQPVWESDGDEESNKPSYSEGLDMRDAKAIKEMIPSVRQVSPEIEKELRVVRSGMTSPGKVVGVANEFFDLNNFSIIQGSLFSPIQIERGERVCVIGASVAKKFFREEKVVGERIKCGRIWLKVIGVLEARNISESAQLNLGIRDYDKDIYIPIQTHLLRFENRSLITASEIKRNSQSGNNEEDTDVKPPAVNYHQVDRITVQVDEADHLSSTADIVSRMLQRRHRGDIDYLIDIPIDKLNEQRKAKERFSIVLGLIAGISLVVGGIGIMNIMLASVLERIKEIGLRMSVGATQKDIIQQFLMESVFISVTGGLIGIALGLITSVSINKIYGILTIVSPSSIFMAFLISASIGIVFGILPAQRAARQDPIKSLRHET